MDIDGVQIETHVGLRQDCTDVGGSLARNLHRCNSIAEGPQARV
jgi:hypothetical protein